MEGTIHVGCTVGVWTGAGTCSPPEQNRLAAFGRLFEKKIRKGMLSVASMTFHAKQSGGTSGVWFVLEIVVAWGGGCRGGATVWESF